VRLYIIRHAEKANSDPDYDDGPDPPITDRGKRQARQLAESLTDERFDCLYSICQRRALQTAAPVHERLDCAWHVWPVFCESTNTWWRGEYPVDAGIETQPVAWRTGEPIEAPRTRNSPTNLGVIACFPSWKRRFPASN
jgi:broad specificity phosphatase PhoE